MHTSNHSERRSHRRIEQSADEDRFEGSRQMHLCAESRAAFKARVYDRCSKQVVLTCIQTLSATRNEFEEFCRSACGNCSLG